METDSEKPVIRQGTFLCSVVFLLAFWWTALFQRPTAVGAFSVIYIAAMVLAAYAHWPKPMKSLLSWGFMFLENVLITAIVSFSGGVSSPLLMFYVMPLGVHAYYQDLVRVNQQAACVLVSYLFLAFTQGDVGKPYHFFVSLGHVLFLGSLVALIHVLVMRTHRHEKILERHLTRQKALGSLSRTLARLSEEADSKLVLKEASQNIQKVMPCPECEVKIWSFLEKNLTTLDKERPAVEGGGRLESWQEMRSDIRFLCLPIQDDKEQFGILQVGCARGCLSSPEDVLFYEIAAHELIGGFKQLKLVKELREKVDELKMTMEVGVSGLTAFTGSIQGMEETVTAVLKQVVHLIHVDRATLLLWDEKQQLLWPRTAAGMRSRPPRLFLRLGEGLAGWSLKIGQPYVTREASRDPHFVPGSEEVRSVVCMPMVSKDGRKLGVLCASTIEEEKNFTDRDLGYLSLFAAHVALALENAQLHQNERRQTKELDILNQLKNDMISVVSHDLQVPLTAILGYSRMLLENVTMDEQERERYVKNILWSAEEQNRIVQNLLNLTRISRGQMNLERTSCDLKILLLSQVEQFRMITSHRPLRILFQAAEEDMVIDLDHTKILQVINNLLANAVKFSPDAGEIQVAIERRQREVHVSVSDKGVGIPPEELDRIFEKYYQICDQKSASRSQKGLGLGLAICKMFVEAHGGRIWAESQGLGLGSTFHFSVPESAVPLSLLKRAA